ncbi:hypothetical protein M8745_20185, partial [Lutimaribacter sp. EGI FJ00014]|nr:hypothetical protein [Lutimaribacter sp. EGI FJ00014]
FLPGELGCSSLFISGPGPVIGFDYNYSFQYNQRQASCEGYFVTLALILCSRSACDFQEQIFNYVPLW